MIQNGVIHHDAIEISAHMAPLLVEARELADAVISGQHGRRRHGVGDEFWQFRPFINGIDRAADIDWRRSAKSDQTYVRQNEWKTPQTLSVHVDPSSSMQIGTPQTKFHRAAVIAIALAILAMAAGEKISHLNGSIPAGTGHAHLNRLIHAIEPDETIEYFADHSFRVPPNSRAVFVSDFLGDLTPLHSLLAQAKQVRVTGVLVQTLLPQEIDFSFDGASIFTSAQGGIIHKTTQAAGLRPAYLARLNARIEEITALASAAGWRVILHRLDDHPLKVLVPLYQALTERWYT